MRGKKLRVGWLGLSCALILVLTLSLLCGCESGGEESVQEETGLRVLSVEEVEDMVLLHTTYGVMKYPYAFSDLIVYEISNEEASDQMKFSARIEGVQYPAFVLSFGGSEGFVLGTMTVPGENTPRTVYAELYPADEAALGEQALSFYAAQESFNDVIQSLAENENFTPAE